MTGMARNLLKLKSSEDGKNSVIICYPAFLTLKLFFSFLLTDWMWPRPVGLFFPLPELFPLFSISFATAPRVGETRVYLRLDKESSDC